LAAFNERQREPLKTKGLVDCTPRLAVTEVSVKAGGVGLADFKFP